MICPKCGSKEVDMQTVHSKYKDQSYVDYFMYECFECGHAFSFDKIGNERLFNEKKEDTKDKSQI